MHLSSLVHPCWLRFLAPSLSLRVLHSSFLVHPCWLRFLAPSLRMWVLHPSSLVHPCWLRFLAPSLSMWVLHPSSIVIPPNLGSWFPLSVCEFCTLPPFLIPADSGSWLSLSGCESAPALFVDPCWLRFLTLSIRWQVCTLHPFSISAKPHLSYRKIQQLLFLLFFPGNFHGPILFHMPLPSQITIFVLSILLPVCVSVLYPLYILPHVVFAALAITAEHSFWLNNHTFPSSVKQAAKLYIKSSAALSVSQQIQTVFQNKSSQIPNITQDYSLYVTHIALSLSDIICNNLLGMSPATFDSAWLILHPYLAHKWMELGRSGFRSWVEGDDDDGYTDILVGRPV